MGRPLEPVEPILITNTPRPAPNATHGPPFFDPGAALAALDALTALRPDPEAARARDDAWDAAWIACTTNSPRWAEAARVEFARAMAAKR